MVDPFKAAARRDRIAQAVLLLMILAILGAFILFSNLNDASSGKEVVAVVTRLGTYPEPLGTGDLPILTVRLPDGSVRQVRTTWSAAGRCVPGRKVSLLQRGTVLEVGLRGCLTKR